jgi:hypothetical protein
MLGLFSVKISGFDSYYKVAEMFRCEFRKFG